MLNTFVETVYKNKLIRLETFTDALEKKERCRIVENDVVVLLAFPDDRHILLERHYRAPIGKWMLELPAGHIEKGETAAMAARKELIEETGYKAKTLKLLYKAYVAPGILTTKSYTYAATGLTKAYDKGTDKEEMLELKTMEFDEVYKLIMKNAIIDKKTIAGVLYYREFFKQNKN